MSDKQIPITIPEDDSDLYGKYTRKSRACSICTDPSHMEINMLRAKQHMSLDDISKLKGISLNMLQTHFDSHFILFPSVAKLINLKESNTAESQAIITSILEGNLDIYAGASGVLESEGMRLKMLQDRLKELRDYQESRILSNDETIEYNQLHILLLKTENQIVKHYQVIRDNLYPLNSKDGLANAFLSFKIDALEKMINDVQLELLEYEKDPKYTDLIRQLRYTLSKRFNYLEEGILKSGGVLERPVEKITYIKSGE
jgi:hypothetical protein